MAVSTPMTPVVKTQSTWLPRRLLEEILGLTALTWAGFVVVMVGIIFSIHIFDEVTTSIWSYATQVPVWYALSIGFYLAYEKLPLYVSFGQTRRDFARRGGVFVVIYSAVLAVLMAIGFLLERVLYRIAGWPQTISDDHLFDSATQVPTIIAEFLLIFVIWTLAGALIGSSFYRSEADGAVSIVVAIIAVSLVNIAVNAQWGPTGRLIERFFSPDSTPLLVSLLLYVVSVGGTGALIWRIVRDLPLRGASS